MLLSSALSGAEDMHKVSLQLKWKYQFQFAGYIVAKEKGFYRDIGLDVELLELDSDVDIVSDVASRKVDFGVSDSSLIYEALKGKPVTVMMAIYQDTSAHITNNPYITKDKYYGFDCYGDMMFTSQAMLKASPEQVKQMYKATKRGWLYAFSHIPETVALIHQKYNSQDRSIEALTREANTLKELSGYGKDFLQLDKETIRGIAQLFNLVENTSYQLDALNNFVYNQKKSAIDFTDEELAYIKHHPIVSIGMTKTFKPFSFISAGIHKGFVVDMLEKISHISGLEFEIQLGSWTDTLNNFKAKSIDMISGISYKKEREAFTLFTVPYYEIPTFVFGLKQDIEYRGVDSLAGRRVGVTKDMFYIDSLKKLGIHVVELDSSDAKVKALAFGEVDYILSSFTSARKSIKKLSFTNIKPFDEFTLIKKEDLRFGINADNQVLHSIVEKVLDSISDYDYEHLANTWILNVANSDAKEVKLSADQKRYLEINPVIKVHNEMSWAPYNFNKDGVAQGFTVDYMNLLASKLGIEIEYISGYAWDEFLGLIKEEKIDVISNIVNSKERAKYINFTTEYIRSKKAIFSNIDNLNNIEDLNSMKVAIPKGFFIYDYLIKNYPNIDIVEYKDTLECMLAVANGEADAIIENYAVVNYLMSQSGISIKYATISVDSELMSKINIGVVKSKPMLRDMLQKAMDIVSDAEMDFLKDKWFGVDKRTLNVLTKEEEAYLKSKESVKICTNPNWEPIEFCSDGVPKGISIDSIKIALDSLNLKPIFVKTTSWSESQEYLRDHKCDILPAAIKTRDREKYTRFTDPYLIYDLAIVTQNDKPLVDSIGSIVDRKMSRKISSGLIDKLKQRYPNIDISETVSAKEALESVRDGDSYFTVVTMPVLAHYKNLYGLGNLQIAGYTDTRYRLSVAVRKDNKLLHSAINKALKAIPEETHKIIADKWIKQIVVKSVDYTLVWKILGVFSLLSIIILIAYLKQRVLHEKIRVLNASLEDRVRAEIDKNKEQQILMLHQSRLAQMGEMISMIAHQWRQPLAAISTASGSIELKANMGTLDDAVASKIAHRISGYSQHLSETIDDFREFFKSSRDQRDTTYTELVDSTMSIIEASVENMNIEIVKVLNSTEHFTTYPSEIKQVILNLMKNAEDALLDKDIQNPQIVITTEGNTLTIADNAGGVPDSIIDKIFDPYFSTKLEKNGTGLGLYMSKTIIEEHCQGELSVTNDKNGAVFKIVINSINSDRVV